MVSPVTDTSCSEPGNKLDTSYVYANLEMRAYYQTTKTIRSLLPSSANDGGSSSYMMSLVQSEAANKLDMLLFAATSVPGAASTATGFCNSTLTVAGGTVAKVASAVANNCPAGSYYSSGSCPPW